MNVLSANVGLGPTSSPFFSTGRIFSESRSEACYPTTLRSLKVESSQEFEAVTDKTIRICASLASVTAAVILTSATQASAEDLQAKVGNMCGDLALVPDSSMILKLEPGQNAFEDGNSGGSFVMGGMTMKNFQPARYAGRWFEVASLKLGFSGQGQEDCHCTQGVYTFDEENRAIKVDTFCVHGSPTGYITGIRGKVQCVSDEELSKLQTDIERRQMIQQKCFLRFPSIPFIPKQPYNVINTDYDNFALVSGSKDTSFVQIYSRTPNPGQEFIEKYKKELADLGFNASLIKDTPQDCEVMSMKALETMMARPGMEEAMTNRFPPLELAASGLELNPFTSIFDTLKKLVQLYFK
ncbi:hypothetical protein R1flu_013570 [Riccia fluitans]|uniref:Lipocalin/cytosolic fatty-acid binding domain-containing protein n=1 Tax=Riccia fluitans TaxID=41844 RepID=A0ABD1YH57_9MARC